MVNMQNLNEDSLSRPEIFFQVLGRNSGNLRNVNEAFQAVIELNKESEIGDPAHAPRKETARVTGLHQTLPGIISQLFHSQGNFLGFRID